MLALCFSICYTCWHGVSLSAVFAGMLSHYQLCLLVWCFIIGHAFSFGTSLSAMPVGVVPHYRSCLLVWCLTVGHVFWCGASLLAMPVCVVPHKRPCLLILFAFQLTFWLIECRRKRDGYKSGASLIEVSFNQTCLLILADPVPLSDLPACTVQLYQTCMPDSFIQKHVFVKCSYIRQEI